MNSRSTSRAIDAVTARLQHFRRSLAAVRAPAELGVVALEALRGISTPLRAVVIGRDEGGALQLLATEGLSDAARDLVAAHAPWEAASGDSGEAVWVDHLAPDPATLASRAAFAREGIVAVAYVPCCFGERRIGTLALCFETPRSFTEQEAAAVESIAAEAALVLEHWRQLARAPASRAVAEAGRDDARALPSPYDVSGRRREQASLLSTASNLLASSLDPDSALEKLAELMVPALADLSITYSCEGQEVRRLGRAHRNPARAPLLDALFASNPPRREDRQGPGAVVRTGVPLLVPRVDDETLARSSLSAEHHRAARALSPRSWLVVPLESRGRIIGALTLCVTDESNRRYDEADLAFAVELGQRVGLLIDNARLYREAREAIRLRDEILAVVSHDLRNPLNTISVASSLLEMGPSPEVSVRAQRSIGRAAKQMERLLQDLLDVSRAEAGKLTLQRAPVDVGALIDEAFALALPQAEDKSVKLERRVAADVGCIDGDRHRLLQVLGNLLGNAIKFVPAGGCVTIGAQDLYGQVRVWISDNGPGIAAEHLPRVFDRFWQASRSGSRGAGLGLTIAKGIIDAHGGQIGVHSHEGEGSTFFCWLPCAQSRAVAAEGAVRGEAREPAAVVPTPGQ